MPNFNDDVNVDGQVAISRPWSDWIFLRQTRHVDGNGGFHIHNPRGNSNQPQGAADRGLVQRNDSVEPLLIPLGRAICWSSRFGGISPCLFGAENALA
jgi:hypothetical protein